MNVVEILRRMKKLYQVKRTICQTFGFENISPKTFIAEFMRESERDVQAGNISSGIAKNGDGACRNNHREILRKTRLKMGRISALERNLAIDSFKFVPCSIFFEENQGYLCLCIPHDCRQKINMRSRKCLCFASPASAFFSALNRLYFGVNSAYLFLQVLVILYFQTEFP